MKDYDFRKLEGKFFIKEHISKMLIKQMIRDSRFFLNHGIIDYSLIVFIVENDPDFIDKEEKSLKQVRLIHEGQPKNLAYHIGIIDYFQLYTIGKRTEKYLKRVRTFDS